MRVEENLYQPRRFLFGEILGGQPFHRGDERWRVPRHGQGEVVGTTFVRT
jgi:hypothetical protein